MILEARRLLVERYILPEVAAELDRTLARAETAGAFAGLSGEALAARVTAEMNAVTPDAHLRLMYQPRLAAQLASGQSGPAPDPDAWNAALGEQMRRTNAGVRKLELLPGNIRYLAYDSFGWGTPGAETAIAEAMAFLRGGDAIIIDLRNNPGGSAFAEAQIASYFLPPGTPLARFELRGDEPADDTITVEVPFSLAGRPTYVLIGPASLSAAEVFATHVSTFGFGKLVGARTGGAGYTVRFFPLPGGYVLNLSVGRTVDALTGADWERVGVAPHIEAPVDRALAVAGLAAMESVVPGMPDALRQQGERLLAFYRANVRQVAAAHPLADYAGIYGQFTVAPGGPGLTMHFADFAPETLVPLGDDVFALEADPTTQVRFIRPEITVVALEIDSGNGPPARIGRQGSAQ